MADQYEDVLKAGFRAEINSKIRGSAAEIYVQQLRIDRAGRIEMPDVETYAACGTCLIDY